jgi:NAD(P)H-hydrate epimerase
MRIVSTSEMAQIENLTRDEYHFDERLIIENVGGQGARAIIKILNENSIESELVFLIGKGNNGSDGLAMARHLSNLGYRCRAFILFPETECQPELLHQKKMSKSFGVSINYIDSAFQLSSYFDQMGSCVVVDSLFGTGVQLPLSNFMYEIIDFVNDNAEFIFAVDICSGIEGDTGFMQGNAIKANATLTIGFPKLGHYVASGSRQSGEVYVLDVGFPKDLNHEGDKFLLRPEHMVDLVNRRDKFADKKVFGHSLVLGGSHGLTGAPALAAQASLRVGSGLVTAATWEPQYQEMIARLIPEIMTGYVPLDIDSWDRIIQDLNKYSSVVIGPGLARSSRARRLVLEVLNNFDGPVVIDADAINVLKYDEDKKAFTMRNAPTILTPHFGEFAKFAGIKHEDLVQKPVEYLKELVDSINCTVVLKGPCTYLGCTDGNVYFNYYPNDGMATGGAGDVLAGILGGLLGQDPGVKGKVPLVQRYEAINRTVAVSIYLHSLTGKFAAEDYGVRAMSAQSLIDSLPKAFDVLEADLDQVRRVK